MMPNVQFKTARVPRSKLRIIFYNNLTLGFPLECNFYFPCVVKWFKKLEKLWSCFKDDEIFFINLKLNFYASYSILTK